jgi:DNA-binding beta-propeller fold protein YncE
MRPHIAAVALLFFAVGCDPANRHVEPTNLFWPPRPEKPRIHYIQSIYSEDDIGHKYSIKETLFGKAYNDTMARPYSIFARGSRIYVADILAMRLLIYDLSEKKFMPLDEGAPLQVPAAVVADPQGSIYVADTVQSRILVFDPQGAYRTSFPLGKAKPVAMAYSDERRLLYVLDRIDHKVLVLDDTGAIRSEFGGKGTGKGKFNIPLAVALDRQGKVYVLDTGNFRVQIFDPEGNYLSHFGQVGDRPGFLANPKGIAVDSDGHIYVTDAAFSNFQIFDAEGNILLVVSRFGTAPGQLYLPAGIYVDQNDRVYVADQFNRRISIFQYLKQN